MTDEIEKKREASLARGMADVVGSTGLRIYGGMVVEEFLPELRGARGARTYREMADNESTLGAVIFAITTLIRQAEWTVQAADDSPEAEEGKVFLEECLDDMAEPFEAVIAEAATMFLYGFAPMEMTFKRRSGPNRRDPLSHSRFTDGRIGIASLALRAQPSITRWDVDPATGRILGLWQQPVSGTETYIPADKILLFRTTEERNNPEGRALDPETPIPTPDGWRRMDDLRPGDRVFDEEGRIRYVTARADWQDRPCYEIEFNTGDRIVADAAHQWPTTKMWERSTGRAPVLRTTEEIAASVKNSNGVSNHAIGWAAPLDYARQALPIDPYFLGLWLGDGTARTANISCHVDDADETVALIEACGLSASVAPNGRKNGLRRLIRVRGREAWDSSGPTHQLRVLGLRGNKHIPEAYLRGDRAQRLALLAGLMDSDGHIDADGRCEFANTNLALIDGVAELVRSLGIGATVVRKALAGEGKRRLDAWLVKFTPEFVPFRLARKVARCKPARARKHHYITAVRPVPPRRTVCIEVDSPSHLFLAGRSMVPTHNSILRSAYRDWYFKKRIEEIEAIGVERDLAGLPVARVPKRYFAPDADPQEKRLLQNWQALVTSIKRDQREGIVMPSEFDGHGNQLFSLELLSTGGSRTFDTTQIIDRRSRAMATAVLADFLFLGQQAVGSFALAQPLSSQVLTPTGWTMMGALKPGDEVICPMGYPSRVLDTFEHGRRPVYRITFADGREVLADADHKWTVTTTFWKKAGMIPKRPRLPWAAKAPEPHPLLLDHGVLSTADLAQHLADGAANSRFHVPRTLPVKFAPQAPLPLDAYILGVLLGDGSLPKNRAGGAGGAEFVSADEEIVSMVEARLPAGHRLSPRRSDSKARRFRISGPVGVGNGRNLVTSGLDALGLLGTDSRTKFIPAVCLTASLDERLALLRGLMDTDGAVSARGQVRFSTVSPALRDGVAALVRSLGGTASITSRTSTGYRHPNSKVWVEKATTSWLLTIVMPDTLNPFCLARKAERVKPMHSLRPQGTGIVRIEPAGEDEMRCIRVSSPSAMYVTDGFTPTHNSSDKTALFAAAIKGFTRSMAAVFNRRLIPLLWELNGWDEEVLPRIVCGDLETPNLAEMAQFVTALAGAGATLFPDRELENHLRKIAGLPLAPEDGGLDGDPMGGAMPGDMMGDPPMPRGEGAEE